MTKIFRFPTKIVSVGEVFLGGNFPIRIQSMTNTNTLDTESTVNQCVRIIEAGADLVRMTVRNIAEAKNLSVIKKKLREKGFKTPLIADVHYNSLIAEEAAKIVEKVRINPGNFVDKKNISLSQEKNLEILQEKFVKLLKICKENGTSLRVGANHGSLSERIVNLYGDTTKGMVESVMEFLRIAENENFYQIVVSLKSSNPVVMINAYREMVFAMQRESMNYPLHLGVTEAGNEQDGRIKSAVGIGALLSEGIGDTIRVSLTEPPENEIPVAKKLIEQFTFSNEKYFFEHFETRENKETPIVIANLNESKNENLIPDFIYLGKNQVDTNIFGKNISFLCDSEVFNFQKNYFPYFHSLKEFQDSQKISEEKNFVYLQNFSQEIFELENEKNVVAVLPIFDISVKKEFSKKCSIPLIFKYLNAEKDSEKSILNASSVLGSFFIDNLGNGIWLENFTENLDLSFGILQASRRRMSRVEYIICPSCGRTLFDIQRVAEEIKQKTSHLKNLKIGIMGCVVNGLGEMADADIGLVGMAENKLSLYQNKKLIKRNISVEKAADEMLNFIKNFHKS